MASLTSRSGSGFFSLRTTVRASVLVTESMLAVQAHVRCVGELSGIGLVERVVLVDHALDREDHVVGVEVAAGLEVVGGVELHTLAQLEGVGQAIGRHRPRFGQAGLDIGAYPS